MSYNLVWLGKVRSWFSIRGGVIFGSIWNWVFSDFNVEGVRG